jgi:hypothetical protein
LIGASPAGNRGTLLGSDRHFSDIKEQHLGIGLGILGGLIALVAFISGAAVSPQSAPQQAV